MNELAYQRLILKSVIEYGGSGFKLSNRFLIGIPDLLITIPGRGTTLWEVKKTTFPYDTSCGVKFKLSKLQWEALKDHDKAGGIGGVIVIATRDKDAFIAAYGTRTIGDTIIRVKSYEFLHLDRGKREPQIVGEIEREINAEKARQDRSNSAHQG